MRIAIITGASGGMGWEFARQLDGQDELDEIWLVARRRENMEELASLLEKTPARIFALDLTVAEQLKGLFDVLETEEPTIVWLVNNAGYGKIGAFDSVEVETNLNMIDLNIRSLTEITQRALPYCERGSKIVQIASSAGWLPVTNFAVYGASKSYVVQFSNALARELKPRGISVTAVCPGPVETEFFNVASGIGTKMDMPEFVTAQADKVVRLAIRDARKGHANSVYGMSIKALGAVSGLIPRSLATWATGKIYG